MNYKYTHTTHTLTEVSGMRQVKINGTNGLYEITDTGLVFSVRKNTYLKLDQSGGGNRYSKIQLQVKGKINRQSVHRLVANHFIPNPENKPCVNHKNGNGFDNRVENLEWCTNKENTEHACQTGLMDNVGRPGELNPQTKLSNNDVLEIRKSNSILRILAEKYGVNISTISNIRNGHSWKHLPLFPPPANHSDDKQQIG